MYCSMTAQSNFQCIESTNLVELTLQVYILNQRSPCTLRIPYLPNLVFMVSTCTTYVPSLVFRNSKQHETASVDINLSVTSQFRCTQASTTVLSQCEECCISNVVEVSMQVLDLINGGR